MKAKKYILTGCLAVVVLSCGKPANVVKPQRQDLVEMVFASGILVADRQYNLTAQTDGYLVKLN